MVICFWKIFAVPVKSSASIQFVSKFVRKTQCQNQFQSGAVGVQPDAMLV